MGLLDALKRKPAPAPAPETVQPVAKVPDPISPKAPTLITLEQLRKGLGITRERVNDRRAGAAEIEVPFQQRGDGIEVLLVGTQAAVFIAEKPEQFGGC